MRFDLPFLHGSTKYGLSEGQPGTEFWKEVGSGLKNAWYSITGQTEKTSAYQAQIAREDSAYQRAAEDMSKAGLSRYQGISGASTGSYGDGTPKGLEYVNAIMDLFTKKVGMDATQAGIRKTNAETENVIANTIGQQNINRTFDEAFRTDMAKAQAQTFLFKAQKDIAEIEGQYKAEQIAADLSYVISNTKLNNANAALSLSKNLYQIGENRWQDAEHESSIGLRDSNRSVNTQQIHNMRVTLKKTSQEITNLISQNVQMQASTKKIVEETAYQMLQYNIGLYNLSYSFDAGLRTTDPTSKIFGINMGQLSGVIRNAITNNPSKFFNFRY